MIILSSLLLEICSLVSIGKNAGGVTEMEWDTNRGGVYLFIHPILSQAVVLNAPFS